MQALEQLVFNTLKAAPQYLDEHAAELGSVPTNPARMLLDGIIGTIESHGDSHTVHKMSARALAQTKTATRHTLVDLHIAPIVAASRAVLSETPELLVVRTVPPVHTSNAVLIRRADEVSKAVAPYSAKLIAAGLPADFQASLAAARMALEAATYDRATSLKKTKGAATGIREQLIAGRKQVRILDRLVRVALHGKDGSLLTEWKGRIAYPRRGRASVATLNPVAAPAPVAATAAAPAVVAAA